MGIAWSSPRQARWAAHRASRASPPLSSRREALKYGCPLFTMEAPMRRVNVVAFAATVALGFLAAFALPAGAQTGVTAFEGARLIVGDGGAPIENATLVVDGARIVAAGRAADVSVPAGAARVNLAGKTVMPMLIDTHVHLSPTRDAIMRDLRRRAYFGVSAALSLGMDNYELLDIRGQTIPGAARFFSAGRGITMPEPGRTHRAVLDHDRGGRPQGGAGARGAQGRHRQDLGRHPRRQVQEADPRNLRRHHRRERTSRACGSPRTSSISRTPKGLHPRRDRCVRARRSRPGHRRRTGSHVQGAPEPGAHAEPAGPRREDGSGLAARQPAGRRA